MDEQMDEQDKIFQTSDDVWDVAGNIFAPASTAAQTQHLRPAIYYIKANSRGWWLEAVKNKFEFPFKIYGLDSTILDRVKEAWEKLDSTLGVLFNGLKGSGKTVCAQLLANWVISKGYPVIVVDQWSPYLRQSLERINTPVMVLFDEFEKTFEHTEEKQALLTILDGLSRNRYKRLFLFTTNTPSIDQNMIDRPSRVRYHFTFRNLGESTIKEIVDDYLDPELNYLKDDLVSWLATRRVRSIDAVKTATIEVNAFKEAPEEFEDFLNLRKRDPDYYNLEIQGVDAEFAMTLDRVKGNNSFDQKFLSGDRDTLAKTFDNIKSFGAYSIHTNQGVLVIKDYTPDGYWIGKLEVNVRNTYLHSIDPRGHFLECHTYFLDIKPEDWEAPEKLSLEEKRAFLEKIDYEGTIYGTGTPALVKMKVFPVYDNDRPDWLIFNTNAF